MLNRRRIEYVTAHYRQIQGLRLLPFGGLFLVHAARTAGWRVWPDGVVPSDIAPAIWLMLSLMAYPAMGAWYDGRYGAVEPWRPHVRSLGRGVVFVWLWSLLYKLGVGLSASRPLTLYLVALFFLDIVRRSRGLRLHYAGLAALWAGLSLLSLSGRLLSPLTYQLIVAGTVFVAGIGDHVLLARTLPGHPKDSHVDQAV